jgi:predicted transcriptional regulator
MGQKKIFSTRIDSDRIKALKHLAVDAEKSLGVLLEEAIWDLCRKYAQKSPSENGPENRRESY